MEIKKDNRTAVHRKAAITTSAFLLVILSVTVLGMKVFSPQPTSFLGPIVEGERTLIGSHTAQATDEKLALNLDINQHLDNLANTLDEVIENTDGTKLENARDTLTAEGKSIVKEEIEKATISVWKIILDATWGKLQAFAGVIWSSVRGVE